MAADTESSTKSRSSRDLSWPYRPPDRFDACCTRWWHHMAHPLANRAPRPITQTMAARYRSVSFHPTPASPRKRLVILFALLEENGLDDTKWQPLAASVITLNYHDLCQP